MEKKNCIRGSFIICVLTTRNIRANNLKSGMCWGRSRHGKDEICINIFVKKQREKSLGGGALHLDGISQ
jgi:hypothetical protein